MQSSDFSLNNAGDLCGSELVNEDGEPTELVRGSDFRWEDAGDLCGSVTEDKRTESRSQLLCACVLLRIPAAHFNTTVCGR